MRSCRRHTSNTSKRIAVILGVVAAAIFLFMFSLRLCRLPHAGGATVPADTLSAYLFPGGQPLGQPRSRLDTDIRMVRVCSKEDGLSFFRMICTGGVEPYGKDKDGARLLGHSTDITDGCLIFTTDVPAGTYEVGIIKVCSPSIITRGIREIHFVEIIKINK